VDRPAPVYAAGGRGLFDLAAAHPFSARVSNVVKIVGLVRREMRGAVDARTPLLVTEMSWSSGAGRSTLNSGWETTEAGQAARAGSPALLVHAAVARGRVGGLVSATAACGAWTPPGDPVGKPALGAFRAVARRLAR
jgi:hypothetical protein